MGDHCMELFRWIFELSAISGYRGGFFGYNLYKMPGKVPCFLLLLVDIELIFI